MPELTVYGYSDDVVVFEGDVEDSIYPPRKGIAILSDGTKIGFEYHGNWMLSVDTRGSDAAYEMYSVGSEKAEKITGRGYTDVVRIMTDERITAIFIVDEIGEEIYTEVDNR